MSHPPVPDRLPPGWLDVVPLGEGAFGRVYRAVDPEGRAVAVKVLAPALASDPDAAWRFAAEHRHLARFDHPGLPRARGEGRTPDGAPFFAMDLVAGGDPSAGAPLAPDAVRAVVAGVAEVLAHLHARGYVHGDLKPENVRVADPAPDPAPGTRTADLRRAAVTLLDLGLLAPIGQRREGIAGTLDYMAPEALRQAPVAPAADLYALGALAYALRTGAPPFQPPAGPVPTPTELVRAHLTAPVPPIRAAAPDPALDALIGDLLAKDPAARPASARAVLARLAGEVPPAEAPALRGATFVGREDVLAAWAGALAADGAATLGLTGGPGMGKGAALDACRLAAQLAGRAWVAAAGGGAPGSAARAVARQALAAAGRAAVARGDGGERGAASSHEAAAAPPGGAAGPAADARVVAWLAGETPADLLELEPAARAAALLAAVAGALAEAARTLGGLAVGLDDWHLADAADRTALARFMAEPAPIAWAVATDPAAAPPPAGAPAIALGPLTAAEVEALLTARLGLCGRGRLEGGEGSPPAALRAALDAVAAGHPLVLDLLLEHAAATGALRHGPDGWAYVDEAPGDQPGASARDVAAGGGPLAQVWRARLAGLDDAARALGAYVGAAAPAGGVPAWLVAATAGLTPEATAASAEALSAAGLVASREGRLVPAAPGVAEALVAAWDGPRRAAACTALARGLVDGAVPGADARAGARGGEALAGGPGPGSGELPLDRLAAAARLAIGGDADDLAADLAAEAGRRFLALPAVVEALAMFDAAIARRPAAATGLAFERAEAARALDRIDEARASYEAALAAIEPAAGAVEGARAAAIRIGLAKCRQLRGDYAGAAEHLAAAREAARAAGRDDLVARAATAQARVATFRGEAAMALELVLAAVPAARAGGRPVVLAQALTLAAVLLAQREPGRAGEARGMLDEAIALARGLGDRMGEGFALEGLGNACMAVGDLAGAAAAFGAQVAAAEAVRAEVELLAARLAVARVEADRGSHGQAAALAYDVARQAAAGNRAFVRGLARAVEGAARWRAGHPDEALAALAEALSAAEGLGNAYMEGYVRLYRVEALLAAGRDGEATEEAGRAEALLAKSGQADVRGRLAAAQAELARREGDAERARALAEPLAAGPNAWNACAARVVLAELAIAAAGGATVRGAAADEALDHAGAARGLAGAWHAPWHDAASRLLFARAAHAAGDAATALDEARGAVLAAGGEEPNPYALGGAGRLLAELGHAGEGRAAQEAAALLLAPARAALGEAAEAWLAAWGLAGLAGAPGGDAAGPAGAIAPAELDRRLEAVVAEADEHAAAAALLRGAIALVAADRGYVLAYEAGRLRGAVTQGLDYAAEVAAGFSETIAAKALYEAEPVYVLDAASDTAFREAASVVALGLRTVVALPLLAGDEVLGVLYMDRQALEPTLGPADLALLMAYARAGAGQLAAARARRAAEDEAARWRACAGLGAALAGVATAGVARAHVLDAVMAQLGATRARWLAFEPPGGPYGAGGPGVEAGPAPGADGWRALAARAAGGATLPADLADVSRGVAAWVRERGEPLALTDALADEALAARGSVQALGLTTVWCLPAGPDVLYLEADRAEATGGEPLKAAAALAAWAAPIVARLPG